MPPPTASEEPHAITAFLRRHLDAIICLGATFTIVLAPAGLPIWVIVAVVVAICFAYQAFRGVRKLAARVEMLEEEAEQQGVYLYALLERATGPQTAMVVRVMPREDAPAIPTGDLN